MKIDKRSSSKAERKGEVKEQELDMRAKRLIEKMHE